MSAPRPASPVRSHLEETCLMCSGVGRWSSVYMDAVYYPPQGHRREYIQNGQVPPIVIDSCQNWRAS